MTVSTLDLQKVEKQILTFYIKHFFQLNQPLLKVHSREFSCAGIFTTKIRSRLDCNLLMPYILFEIIPKMQKMQRKVNIEIINYFF